MRAILNRAELSSVLNDAEKIAPANAPMDVLKGVLLEAEADRLIVTASNGEFTLKQTIPGEVQESGSIAFDAKLLAAMVRLLDGETVCLQTEPNHQLTVMGGAAVYTASAFDPTSYPQMTIPFPEDTVAVTGIPAIAKRTAFAVREDDSKPILRCINLIFSNEGLKAVGSDGYRIAAAQGDRKSTGEVSLLIPAASLEKLARLVGNRDTLMVGTTGKSIVFTKENFVFSARLMDGQPINVQMLLSSAKAQFTVLTDADAMRTAVDGVLCVSDGMGRLRLLFNGNRVEISCYGENGEASGTFDVVALSGTPTGEYWYNGRQLCECLRAQTGTMMLDVAQGGILLLRTDDLICMQTARRKPASVQRKNETPLEKAA